jgi:hypothetical protein
VKAKMIILLDYASEIVPNIRIFDKLPIQIIASSLSIVFVKGLRLQRQICEAIN